MVTTTQGLGLPSRFDSEWWFLFNSGDTLKSKERIMAIIVDGRIVVDGTVVGTVAEYEANVRKYIIA